MLTSFWTALGRNARIFVAIITHDKAKLEAELVAPKRFPGDLHGFY